MTTPNLTAVPTTAKPRKARGWLALGLVGTLALGGTVAGITMATPSAKDETAVTWETQLLSITATETATFNLTPGAETAPQFVNIANTGGAGIRAHAAFAPGAYIPSVPAALQDSIVRVWDTAVSGENNPTSFWEGTLEEFLATSFVSNTAIAGGSSATFGVAVATPLDVDANQWLMENLSESYDTSEFISLLVQTDLDSQSALTAGTVFDSAAGLRTGTAALVLDAASALNGGGQVAFPAFDEDSATVPGFIIRTFYTDPSKTTVIGSILLDASLNEGDTGYITDADYDGNGQNLDLYGIAV